jgi:hypothetical protein
MSIGNIAGAGGVVFGNIQDTKSLPLQTLTALVMAEVMQTREAEQQQKVEEIAAQNAKAKQFNDMLGEVARLTEAFSADEGNTARRTPKNHDEKPDNIGKTNMDTWKKLAEPTESFTVTTPGNGEVAVRKYQTFELKEMSFEQRLNLLGPNTTPALTADGKERLMARAKLADMSKEFGMLTGGSVEKGSTYENIAYGDVSKGTLETLKTKLRTAAEAISTNNQLEMIKLQSLIGAVDAAKTALTQYVKTSGDAEKEIVQKF